MLGAFLSGLVLGAFVLAVAIVLTINAKTRAGCPVVSFLVGAR